jgi:hypothetical protein
MDHDQSFKNLFLDYPVAALELFAGGEGGPDLGSARVVPIREQQLKERLGDRFRELDVPLLLEWPDGQREAVLFVLEEETDPGSFSIHRLARYCLDLAELMKTERVVPVVVFLRRGGFPKQLSLRGELGVYLSFRFLYCELARLPAASYFDSRNIVARVNLPNMRFPPEQRVEIYARAMEGLLELEQDWNRQRKYAGFIDQYADLSDAETERYRAEYVDKSGGQAMGLIAKIHEEGVQQGLRAGMQQGIQQGVQQGIQQGVQQGVQQGRRQGESLLLSRLLARRFGALPAWAEARLAEAEPWERERWGERQLDPEALSLEAVFRND